MHKEPYYLPAGLIDGVEAFTPTTSTISVWATTMQHGSPPAALLARAIERCAPLPGSRITRFSMDILGPIPVTEHRVRAWVERPGKQIALICAELLSPGPSGEFRPVARASAWRLATAETTTVESARDLPLTTRAAGVPWDAREVYSPGYIDSLEWARIATAGPDSAGEMWLRPLVELVAGEAMSPLQRLLSVVDSANGIGAKLDIRKWTFLNTDLVVHVHREPRSEWIGLAAETSVGPDGIGMCASVIHDEDGPIGRSAQTLLVRPR